MLLQASVMPFADSLYPGFVTWGILFLTPGSRCRVCLGRFIKAHGVEVACG